MKPYLKYLTAATLLALPLSAQAHDLDKDAKRDVIQTYDFQNFDKIEVAGIFLLDVKAGDEFSVRTEARKKDAEHLDVRLRGDTLILDIDDDDKRWNKKRSRNNRGVLAVITMPNLEALTVAGIASGHVEAFTGGNVYIEVAGIGDLALSGTCNELKLEFAGMGDVDARDLECKDVEADMGGMGALKVYASESVDATIGGMGSIDVYGSPKTVKKDKSMFSSIHVK